MRVQGPTSAWLVAAALAALAALAVAPGAAGAGVDLEPVAAGLDRPTAIAAPGDGSGNLFVTEQAGRIRSIDNGELLRQPFLDIESRVFSAGGNGLLGLAFHPDYAANGFFFVHYVDLDGHSTISRFRVSGNPHRARAASETVVFLFDEPAGGHKGGDIAFGPDGYLYVAMGDRSGGGDPDDNAQNTGNLFGAVLRLDVDSVPALAAPDNPFTGDPAARDEIWAYGLRNPWRLSFDSATGDLFIADVGERTFEEVNHQPAASPGGENYGWRRKEGSACFEPATDCDAPDLVGPVLEYGPDLGCSIIGGYVYRGARAPTLGGLYLYADFCAGTIWGAAPNRDGLWVSRRLAETGISIVAFGRDDAAELYVADYASGSVHRISSREVFASGFESGGLRGWRGRGPVRVESPGLGGSGYALVASVGDAAGGVATARRRLAPLRAIETELTLDFRTFDVGAEAPIAIWADGRGDLLRLLARRVSRRRVELTLNALEAGGGERRVGRFRVPAARELTIFVEWRSASAPGLADGAASWRARRAERGAITNLDTGERAVRTFEVGVRASGAGGAASGQLRVDDVVLAAGRP